METTAKEEVQVRPRPLHKTCSLFMRSIAPSISKAEIVAVRVMAPYGGLGCGGGVTYADGARLTQTHSSAGGTRDSCG